MKGILLGILCLLHIQHGYGVTVNPAAVTTYTTTLSVVDTSFVKQTEMDLGDSAYLEFEMVIDDYDANMDLAGARVTNCIVSKADTFTSPVTIIGSDGCFDDVDIFDNMNTNTGFARHSNSGTTGSGPVEKTYIAYSPKFEMSGFARAEFNVGNPLYFRCDVTFCLDDTDSSTAGQCGASHCSTTTRKKRSTEGNPETSVFASVNITSNRDSAKECVKCSTSTIFKATMAALGTAGAIVFAVMAMSFVSAKGAIIESMQLQRQDLSSRGTGSTSTGTGSDIKLKDERMSMK